MTAPLRVRNFVKDTGKLLRFPGSRSKSRTFSDLNLSKFGKGLIDSEMAKLKCRFQNPKTELDWRNKVIFLLLSTTGLRANELVNLRLSEKIQLADGTWGIQYRRKGGELYVAIPSVEAMKIVSQYHSKFCIESDYLLNTLISNVCPKRQKMTTRTLQRIIDSWAVKRADGGKASPHSFRHTVGQRTFVKAGSIAAQKILGHSSPLITSKFYTLPYYDGSKILKW